MVSFLSRLVSGSLKSSYFLILVLMFRSLGQILRSPSKSSRSIYLSPSLTAVYAIDSLIYKEAPYLLPIGVLIRTLNL